MNFREAAQLLGISPATLSLVLNQKPGISDKRRKEIFEQIEALGLQELYSRTRKAKEPSAEDAQTILFLVYRKTGTIVDMNPFFLNIIGSMEKEAANLGYKLVTSVFDASLGMERLREKVDAIAPVGMIVSAAEMKTEDLDALKTVTIPFVMMDNHFVCSDVYSVSINNRMGTYKAVRLLKELGHTEIGYLRCQERIMNFVEREEGYRIAAEEFGMTLKEEHIFDLPFREGACYREFRKILESSPSLPTAFVSDADHLAIGALQALQEVGIRVPEDISVVGFDDRPGSEECIPPLTTVNVPKASFGEEAVNALDRLLKEWVQNDGGIRRSHKVRIGTYITERNSAGPAGKKIKFTSGILTYYSG